MEKSVELWVNGVYCSKFLSGSDARDALIDMRADYVRSEVNQQLGGCPVADDFESEKEFLAAAKEYWSRYDEVETSAKAEFDALPTELVREE